jgi:hypothetical protein
MEINPVIADFKGNGYELQGTNQINSEYADRLSNFLLRIWVIIAE